MAGGVGSRLWPLSTPKQPKQFIDILGTGKSLLQMTYERFSSVCNPENFWIVTSSQYADVVSDQLPEIPNDNILLEPMPRNTAPCIAYACWKIGIRHPDANIVVTPADAVILNQNKFVKVISTALDYTQNSSAIVTVGINPHRPDTGYGYICAEKIIMDQIVKVDSFKEKPDLATAKEYILAGNYFWNAGIFVWNINTIVNQLRTYVPQITNVMDKLCKYFYTQDEEKALLEYFPQCDKISIDYAVMEKSPDVHVIASALDWSDLGSWSSVKKYSPMSDDNNSIVGNGVLLDDCQNCVVHVSDDKNVVIEGLEDYIVAEKNGDILICKLKNEQMIKEFSQNLIIKH